MGRSDHIGRSKDTRISDPLMGVTGQNPFDEEKQSKVELVAQVVSACGPWVGETKRPELEGKASADPG